MNEDSADSEGHVGSDSEGGEDKYDFHRIQAFYTSTNPRIYTNPI